MIRTYRGVVSKNTERLMVFVDNILFINRKKKKSAPKGMITSEMISKLNGVRKKNEQMEERRKRKEVS